MKMKTKVIANFTSPSKQLSIIFVAEFFDNRDSSYSLAAVRHNSAAPVCHLFYSQSGQNVSKLFALAVSILTIQWTFLDFVLKVHLGSFILRARNNTIF